MSGAARAGTIHLMAKKLRPRPDAKLEEGRMSFGEHLEELRQRIIYALIGLFVAAVACLFFARDILKFVCQPAVAVFEVHDLPARLQALSVQEPFMIWVRMGILGGLVVGGPFALWQMWQFITVGLYARERRFVRMTVPLSVALFAVGVLFFHFCVLPIVLHFFVGFSEKFTLGDPRPTALQRLLLAQKEDQIGPATTQPDLPSIPVLEHDPDNPRPGQFWIDRRTNQLRIATRDGFRTVTTLPGGRRSFLESQFRLAEYVSFVLALYLAFGLAFQLPIIVVFLIASGIVDAKRMARARKYVIFGIFVAAAALTPPDVISQLLLGIPMVGLFELGLLVSRLIGRRAASPGQA